MITYVLLAVIAIVLAYIAGTYNGLIRLRTRKNEAWSDIDVQLKRRHNLIPNLVETVKGYASHERELFEKVTEARSHAMQAQGVEEQAKAENQLYQTVKSLFAVAENYPNLKASENFVELQRELTDTEDKIQASRRFYNSQVRDLNIKIDSFPSNIIANMLGFKKAEFFEIDDAERENPEVKF